MAQKDAYYFSHDSNSRNDLKMVKLRRREGLTGIGLFWCVIEMLRESKGYELFVSDIEDICYELRCEESNFESLFICELLVKENDVFYSISLKNRLLRMDEIKEKKRIAGSKGGRTKANNKQNLADATKTPSKTVAKPSKEIREDKTREDKSKEDKELLKISQFENCYSIYPNKNARQATQTSFNKLLKKHSAEDLKKAVDNYNEKCKLEEIKAEFKYTSNNFFGQKSYYKDFLPEFYKKSEQKKQEEPVWNPVN